MKDLLIGLPNELFVTNIASVLPYAYTNGTTFEIHDSVIVYTKVVKNHGESLLIVLEEATTWLAEPGSTLLPTITNVFPLPFGNTPKDLQVHSSYSYKVSLS